tara:strand:+ start:7721 stop:8290 length:570 start_codon:yes stop_codon:yes gene_type:complete
VDATESELIEAAQNGDSFALDKLLRSHYDMIFSICRKLTGNENDANDAVQESLISIARGLPSFRRTSKLSTWIYRITTNAALDELRKQKRRPIPVDEVDYLPNETTFQLEDAVVSSLDIKAALDRLPEEFRTPIVLREQTGMNYSEISSILNIPTGTVKSRIARARSKLKDDLLGNKSKVSPVIEVTDE